MTGDKQRNIETSNTLARASKRQASSSLFELPMYQLENIFLLSTTSNISSCQFNDLYAVHNMPSWITSLIAASDKHKSRI